LDHRQLQGNATQKKMRPGQPADVRVDAFSRKYRGYVENMPGATGARTSLLPAENATGNFVKVVQRMPVRIRFEGRRKSRPDGAPRNVRGAQGVAEIGAASSNAASTVFRSVS
jgi:hypothetical protein